ncbi:MAG: virginiamycin B lyase family protein, partial [Candidatus Acidiferrales bacterium]
MNRWVKVVALPAILVMFAGMGAVSNGWAQASDAPNGTISGVVTADRAWALSEASGEHIPALVAVRVRAHDIERHIYYTVFTKDAHYHIYNLPPGTYEMSALKDSFDSSGPTVTLKAGETATADVALKAIPDFHLRAELGDMDFVFPPSPTRTYIEENCMGCHGFEHIPWQRMPKRDGDAWAAAVSRMFNTWGTSRYTGVAQVNPAAIPQDKRDEIAKYFSSIFPEDGPRRDFKLADLPLDEDALSKAVDIEYEMPQPKPGKTTSNHDVWPSTVTPTVYMAEMGNDSILALDTRRIDFPGRWRTYPLPNPDEAHRELGPHGITQTPNGMVYTAEIDESSIGELDPETGKVNQYETPTRSTPHTIAYDSKGNLWFTEMQGKSLIGKFDPKTRKITEYDPSPSDANAHYYGLNVDQKDRVWAVGMT